MKKKMIIEVPVSCVNILHQSTPDLRQLTQEYYPNFLVNS